jgi:hypothetical protein
MRYQAVVPDKTPTIALTTALPQTPHQLPKPPFDALVIKKEAGTRVFEHHEGRERQD